MAKRKLGRRRNHTKATIETAKRNARAEARAQGCTCWPAFRLVEGDGTAGGGMMEMELHHKPGCKVTVDHSGHGEAI